MIARFPWRKRRHALLATLIAPLIALALLAGGPAQRIHAESGGWRPIGPDGGATGRILVHPTDPDRIFITSITGFFRSDDGGEHWRTLYVSKDWSAVPLAVALHPTAPDTLYAIFATGGFLYHIQLFVSHDGGESWRLLFDPPIADDYGGSVVPVLTIAPSEPESIYLFANQRLYKSEDGGDSWTRLAVSGQVINALVVSPSDANRVYAITVGDTNLPAMLLKSEDAGAHWVGQDIPGDWGIGSLAGHPTDPDTIFFGASDGLHVSQDGGRSWSKTGLNLWQPSNISISPVNPAIMYAIASNALFKSVDGGVNWRMVDDPLSGKVGTGVSQVAVHPTDPDVIFINEAISAWLPWPLYPGSTGGFYRSEDGGDHWRHFNQGLPNAALSDFAFSPTTGALYTVGGLGAFRRDPGSPSWVAINSGLGEIPPTIQYIAVSPGDPETLYIVSQLTGENPPTIYASQDRGESWRETGKPNSIGLPRGLIIAPASPPVLYLISETGEIEKSQDSGASWTILENAPPGALRLVADPTDPNRLYVIIGTSPWDELWRSSNGGRQWTKITLPETSAEYGSLDLLAVDSSGGVYVRQGVYGPLLRSDNRGESWEALDALPLRSPLYDIAFDPTNPAHMVIATNNGVSVSWDQGRSWMSAGQPLSARRPVRRIAMDPMNSQRLAAMSQWDGIYEKEFIVRETYLPLIGASGDDADGGRVDITVSGAWVQPPRLDPDGAPWAVVQPQQLVTGQTLVQYWRGTEESIDPDSLQIAILLAAGDRLIDCRAFPHSYNGRPRTSPFPGQQEMYVFSFVAPEQPGRYNLTAGVITGELDPDAPPLCPQGDDWQSALPPNATRIIGEVVVRE